MYANRVKSELAAGRTVIGTLVVFIRNPAVMRMIAAAGYDFVFIDMEHAAFSNETVSDMCEVARGSGLIPLVRPYSHDGPLGNKILDFGAMGLIYPHVERREQIDLARTTLFYPPIGDRSSFLGAIHDYQSRPASELNAYINDSTMLVIEIESADSVAHIDDLLAGGGVDVAMVGRGDLSKALGVPGDRQHPTVLAALDRVAAAGARHGVAIGCSCDSPDDARSLVDRGIRFLLYPTDIRFLMRTYADGSKALRNAIAAAKTG